MTKEQKAELTAALHKEYKECKAKYDNLHRTVVAWEAGVLPASVKPAEPIAMFKEQKGALGHYLFCLEKRMAYLKIDLPK
jgi:hypothetical protein